MPKKMGLNSKAEEARGRKAAAEAEKKVKEQREKEDKFWMEAEGQKSKAAKKKEEEAERRAEAAAKRAEAKKLAEQEEAEIEKSLRKLDKKLNRVAAPVPKVTAAELAKYKEQEAKDMQATAQAAKKREARTVEEEEYEKLVAIENKNRDDTLVDAHDVQSALAQIVITETTPDRHPERRIKASYKAFEEAELQRLKQEKPGTCHSEQKQVRIPAHGNALIPYGAVVLARWCVGVNSSSDRSIAISDIFNIIEKNMDFMQAMRKNTDIIHVKVQGGYQSYCTHPRKCYEILLGNVANGIERLQLGEHEK
ncbi:hypothetical protein R1flu_009612 [Riccia fluitans]|uniref:Coiled-coil domain-containing protein n=1 Tax=Riccia fluitans TaxID=41844 RepID=A0ABD1Z2S9_9MARC